MKDTRKLIQDMLQAIEAIGNLYFPFFCMTARVIESSMC